MPVPSVELTGQAAVGFIPGTQLPYLKKLVAELPRTVRLGRLPPDPNAEMIHLGEYLTAKFTAKRHTYSTTRTRILVPGGPPIAT